MRKQSTHSRRNIRIATHRAGIAIPALLLATNWVLANNIQDGLRECAALDTDAERLECASSLIEASTKTGTEGAADRRSPTVPAGSTGTSAGAPTGAPVTLTPEPEPDDEVIVAALTDAKTGRAGWYTFYLNNGQTWRQIDATRSPLSLKMFGQPVTIKRGSFSSYRMYIDDRGPMVWVRRID